MVQEKYWTNLIPDSPLMGFAPRAGKASKRLPTDAGPRVGASLPLLPPSSPEGRVAGATLIHRDRVADAVHGFKVRDDARRLKP